MGRLILHRGDITQLDIEAIVNAANRSLLGGSGVDGAIHRAAGPSLLEDCKQIGGCETGDARITGGHRLKAKFVIHTVGPVWNGGSGPEHVKLRSCYRKSLQLAYKQGIREIAFPNISTGIYGFPKNLAAEIAIDECRKFLGEHPDFRRVIFCTFDEENFNIYNSILKHIK